ncbi:hypothetical protein [Streptomyces sp. NPDC017673]|uniref:hypothetical protein n=1 Tax=unclassified Streptomyces TaxID=2593676 RepID=UPI00379FE5E5
MSSPPRAAAASCHRPHAPLAGEFAADPAVCHHAYQVAIDFGFVAVDVIADLLPQEDSLAPSAWGSATATASPWTTATSPAGH